MLLRRADGVIQEVAAIWKECGSSVRELRRIALGDRYRARLRSPRILWMTEVLENRMVLPSALQLPPCASDASDNTTALPTSAAGNLFQFLVGEERQEPIVR